MNIDSKVYVAGHCGMVGSAIVKALSNHGYSNLITRTHGELDLINQQSVEVFFQKERPDYVILAAAKVGGILANSQYPADFIYHNLMIQTNVIHQAYKAGVKQFMFLGSSCIYPKLADQPIKESALLTGVLEPTNEPYAIAKIAGIKLCESYNRQYGTDFRSLMPTNLYGPNDNYDLENSHVIPALIRKIHQAKVDKQESVEVWGTGNVRREFLYVDDLARACLMAMQVGKGSFQCTQNSMSSHVNVGAGEDLTIKELVDVLTEVIGFSGEIIWDTSMPDGTPRKLLDVTKLSNLGWRASTKLNEGLTRTYQAYLESFLS